MSTQFKCDRCEDEYDMEEQNLTYGLILCDECYGSFDGWIRCKIG